MHGPSGAGAKQLLQLLSSAQHAEQFVRESTLQLPAATEPSL